MFNTDVFKPARFIGHGEVVIDNKTIPFRSVSEDNVFYDRDGKPIASVFSFSYFREDAENAASRPVIFAFNGGPGSSSCMLHVGFLGPRRMAFRDNINSLSSMPPYRVQNNPECLLDIADIVIVDPVATGFGLLLDESHSEDFFGIKEDAEAILNFMQLWLQRYERWSSPKYIIGESYGCTRAAMIAELASGPGTDRCYDIAFDGIMFIGNTVTTGQYFGRDVPVEKAVLGFPTYAAINWYHNTDHSVPLNEWVRDAKTFADNDYLVALYKGASLKDDEKKHVVNAIMHYTGVSESYIYSHHMKIDSYSVKNEILRDKRLAVSRLDGRVTRSLYSSPYDEIEYGMTSDAVRGRYNPVFLGSLISECFPVLGIHSFERQYKSAIKISKSWNKDTDLTGAECLRNAMQRLPELRLFFANGYYDLTTEIGILYYMLDHADLAMDRVSVKGYPSGHMIYLGDDNIAELSDDLRAFIKASDAY